MNICEYIVKERFFQKVERFRKCRDMNIVEAIEFLGMRKTAYYEAKRRGKTTIGVIEKLLSSRYGRKIFIQNDFEKIGSTKQ